MNEVKEEYIKNLNKFYDMLNYFRNETDALEKRVDRLIWAVNCFGQYLIEKELYQLEKEK